MCTVTFLPVPTGFILTSNRDESPIRAAVTFPPKSYQLVNTPAFFPKDPMGGTWIAVSGLGHIHCLLNGAFEKHKHLPPYRMSRGIVMLESLGYETAESFASDYNFDGIEPFTMVMVNTAGGLTVHEFRWDGTKVFLSEKSVDQPLIWSSASLYDPTARKKREEIFHQWVAEHPDPNPETILQLHLTGGYGDPENNYSMKRNGVQTVSVTQIVESNGGSTMMYRDLLSGDQHELELY